MTGCGGAGGAKKTSDPIDNIPAKARDEVAAAEAVKASDFPKPTAGQSIEKFAEQFAAGGPQAIAGTSVYSTPRSRIAFGLLDDEQKFVYGATVVYVAPNNGGPIEGPFPAPADVLLTEARYRSQQAATEKSPFAAIYEAQVPFAQPGIYNVLIVSDVGGKRDAATLGAKVIAEDDHIPDVGERAPKVRRTRAARSRATSACWTRASRPGARAGREVVRRRGRQEAGGAAVLHAAAVPVARVRPGHRRDAPAEGQVRRPDGVHPPGGLQGQRPQPGLPATAASASACRASRGCSRSARTAGSPRAWRGRSASGRSRPPSRPPCSDRGLRARARRSEPTCRSPPWPSPGAAAAVLVISFVGLAALWPKPRLAGRRLASRCRAAARWVARLAPVRRVGVCSARASWSGPACSGEQAPQDNFAPTFVYVVFWVGLVFASLLFGDVFRAFNPWRPLGRVLRWDGPAPPTPSGSGCWPAALGLLFFTWTELAGAGRRTRTGSPIGGDRLHRWSRWRRCARYGGPGRGRGEAFGVYFDLFSRLSIFETRDGVVGRRPLLERAAAPRPGARHRRGRGGDDRHGHLRRAVARARPGRTTSAVGSTTSSTGSVLARAPRASCRHGRAAGSASRWSPASTGWASRARESVGGGLSARAPARRRSCTRWCRSRWSTRWRTTSSSLVFQGQEIALSRVGPARRRLGPVRHRGVRRSTRRCCRRTPSGTSRSRSWCSATSPALVLAHDRALTVYKDRASGRALAVLDAVDHGRLHVAGAVAAVAGERLTLSHYGLDEQLAAVVGGRGLEHVAQRRREDSWLTPPCEQYRAEVLVD